MFYSYALFQKSLTLQGIIVIINQGIESFMTFPPLWAGKYVTETTLENVDSLDEIQQRL